MKSGAGQRGAVLLEVVVALAVFVGAALAVMACVDRAASALEHTRGVQRAADLARSAMSQLEAGLLNPAALNGPVPTADSSGYSGPPYAGGGWGDGESGWELEVQSEPSEFGALSKVTVTAIRRGESGAARYSYSLTQLVRLGERSDETAGAVR